MAAWRAAALRPGAHFVWINQALYLGRNLVSYCHEQAYLLSKGEPAKSRACPARRRLGYYWQPLPPGAEAAHGPAASPTANPAAFVLDPFTGSGAAVVAAKQLGWQYVAIELEPSYCDVASGGLSGE